MKSIAVVLAALFALEAAWCDSSSEEVIHMLSKCSAETNVKADDVKPFLDGAEITKDAKCFLKCGLMSYGTLMEDGTIDVSKRIHKSPLDESTQSIAEECASMEKNDDLCELAYQHLSCVLRKDKDGKMKRRMAEDLEKM